MFKPNKEKKSFRQVALLWGNVNKENVHKGSSNLTSTALSYLNNFKST
jgi:hypothetical protein